MDLFYKGHKVVLEETDVIGGVKVTYDGETKVIARQARHNGRNFTDIMAAAAEIKASINAGNFNLNQLAEYSPCIRIVD